MAPRSLSAVLPATRAMHLLLVVTTISLSIPLASAGRVVLDDRDPSIVYRPDNLWLVRGAGVSCDGCSAQPDIVYAYGSTFHDTSSAASAALTFNGTGFEVFAIIPNGPSVRSSYSLSIDGQENATYQYVGTGSSAYNYHQSIFRFESLPLGSHTLEVANNVTTGSTLLLDSIAVDMDGVEPPSSSPTPNSSTAATPVAAIAGGVAGGIVLLLLITGAGVWLLRRRRRAAMAAQRVDLTDGDAFEDKEEAENPDWVIVTPYPPSAPQPNFNTRPQAPSSPALTTSETLPLTSYAYAETNDSQTLLSPMTPLTLEKSGYGYGSSVSGSEASPTTPSGSVGPGLDLSSASAPPLATEARVENPDEQGVEREEQAVMQHRDAGEVRGNLEEVPPEYSDRRPR